MSGFISFLFALLFTVTLTLAIVYRQENRKRLARIFGSISVIFALVTVVAGAVYYLSPSPQVIHTIGPLEKPYLYIKEARMEAPLTAGKTAAVLLEIQNGPTESSLVFRDISYVLTGKLPTKYLRYSKGGNSPTTLKFGPRQVIAARWSLDEISFTQEEIDALNARPPALEFYAYARGDYTNDTGKHSLNACFRYEGDFPTRLVICPDDIKVE